MTVEIQLAKVKKKITITPSEIKELNLWLKTGPGIDVKLRQKVGEFLLLVFTTK